MRSVDRALPLTWRKSTHSGPSNGCVEVARVTGNGIGVRDSKDVVASPILHFELGEWRSFLGTIKADRLNLV